MKAEPGIPFGLVQITEEAARALLQAGKRVFAHSFHPLEVSHFDPNGFQQWAKEGYRFEAARYYASPEDVQPPSKIGGEKGDKTDG